MSVLQSELVRLAEESFEQISRTCFSDLHGRAFYAVVILEGMHVWVSQLQIESAEIAWSAHMLSDSVVWDDTPLPLL